MKNLVLAVSPDSSLELLSYYADIIVLDKTSRLGDVSRCDTVYIRSHFSQQDTMPQNFKNEIETITQKVKSFNPRVKFIDDMDNVEAIVAFEDKWHQYKLFSKFMPLTELLDENTNTSRFLRPLFKKRTSSRGRGVTWDINASNSHNNEWVIQETLTIAEELRVYIICDEIYPVSTVRQSKSLERRPRLAHSRQLAQDELDFSRKIARLIPNMDMIGLDIARTIDGRLKLIEANRSPGFAKFHQLTDINLASVLYSKLDIQ